MNPGALLVELTSIHWQEVWKYGERAFRYCQHDVGHALSALSLSAASLGWLLEALESVGDATLMCLVSRMMRLPLFFCKTYISP